MSKIRCTCCKAPLEDEERSQASSSIIVNLDDDSVRSESPVGEVVSTKNKSNDVADLEDYIRTSYYDDTHVPSTRPLFARKPGRPGPQLRKSRTNRIIIFRGCFNPPHRGHWELLNGAFSYSQDLNVVAAIVYPSFGSGTKSYAKEVFFSAKEKARLWSGDKGPHDWLWVYDHTGRQWDDFHERLVRDTKKDGFAIEYICLIGPDHVQFDRITETMREYSGWIVSDAGRKADFVNGNGTMDRLLHFSRWKPISNLTEKGMRVAMDKARWLPTPSCNGDMARDQWLVAEMALEYIDRIEGVRVCTREAHPYHWIRFVPRKTDSMIGISSTNIRKIIATNPHENLLELLKDKALNPKILVKLRRTKRPGSPLTPSDQSKRVRPDPLANSEIRCDFQHPVLGVDVIY